MSSILDVRARSKVHQLWNSCHPYLVSPWLSSQSSQFQEMAWRPTFTKQLSPNHSQSISVLKTQSALSGSAPELPLKHPIHVPSQSQDSMFAELLTLRMSADSTPSFPAPWWHPQDSVSHQRQDIENWGEIMPRLGTPSGKHHVVSCSLKSEMNRAGPCGSLFVSLLFYLAKFLDTMECSLNIFVCSPTGSAKKPCFFFFYYT